MSDTRGIDEDVGDDIEPSSDPNNDATTSSSPDQDDSSDHNNNNGVIRHRRTSNNSGTTTTTTTRSALHNRLLHQQRSNILLQVLFHHMLHSSRRRRQEEEEALALQSRPPPLPDREMAVLGRQEGLATNAICRFCFEGYSSTTDDDETLQQQQQQQLRPENDDKQEDRKDENSTEAITISSTEAKQPQTDEIMTNALVAPCNCSGGSRWVHLECLRQWQRTQARSISNTDLVMDDLSNSSTTTTYTAAGYICNVCNSPYLSRPPAATIRSVRRNLLRRGTLLVSKATLAMGRTFSQTVILLLTDVCTHPPHGPIGVIVNAPLSQELLTPQRRQRLLLQATQQQQQPPPPPPSQQQRQDDSLTLLHNHTVDSASDNDNDNIIINNNSSNNPLIEWRRGGPVCGGRLGVVHYTILHTLPPRTSEDDLQDDILDVDIDEEYFDENDIDNDNDNDLVGDGGEEDHNDNNINDDDNDDDDNDDDDDDDDDHQAMIEDDNLDIGDIEAPPVNSGRTRVNASDSDDGEGNNDNDEDNEEEQDSDDPDEHNDNTCGPLSLPVFDFDRNTPPLQFVASPNTQLPSTFSEENLGLTIQRLVSNETNGGGNTTDGNTDNNNNNNNNMNGGDDDNDDDQNADIENNNNSRSRVIVFSGYCKWRVGQLEREIQREVWDVCIDATPADILRHHDTGFWEEISQSNRLLSWQRLIEESESAHE